LKISAEDENSSETIIPLEKRKLSLSDIYLSDSEQDNNETTTINSNYGLNYHKNHGFTLTKDTQLKLNANENRIINNDEKYPIISNYNEFEDIAKQKFIVKTIIHSENQQPEKPHVNRWIKNRDYNSNCLFDRYNSLENSCRSKSTSCLLGKLKKLYLI